MHRTRPALACTLLLAVAACSPDAAEREYLAALRGDEDGTSYEDRVARLDRAIVLQPTRARYYEARAILRIDRQEFSLALDDLDLAVVAGDRPYLRFLRGLVLCQHGDCEAGLPDLDLAIEQQPENVQFYRGRSLALSALGRLDDALSDAEHLVATSPRSGRSFYARGVALAGLGRHDEAVADFDEALRLMPELVYPLLARAASRDARGNVSAAAVDRETAEQSPVCAYCADPFRY